MMRYAIELNDENVHDFGVVHREGCPDLKTPVSLGYDWKQGVSKMGPDWALDVESGLIRVAPCAL